MSAAHIAHLHRRLEESCVPEQLHEGLINYIAGRRPVGGFLTAVLSNDLRDAITRAESQASRRYSRPICADLLAELLLSQLPPLSPLAKIRANLHAPILRWRCRRWD